MLAMVEWRSEIRLRGGVLDASPATFEQSATQKHNGSYAAHIVDSTTGQRGIVQALTLVSGHIYKASFWYYIVSGALINQINNADVTYSTTGSWQYAERVVTYNSGYNNIYFLNAGGATTEFYIDDVSVQEVTGSEGIGWGFDGVSYINCGQNPSIRLTGNTGSLLAWIRPSSPMMLNNGVFGRLSSDYGMLFVISWPKLTFRTTTGGVVRLR